MKFSTVIAFVFVLGTLLSKLPNPSGEAAKAQVSEPDYAASAAYDAAYREYMISKQDGLPGVVCANARSLYQAASQMGSPSQENWRQRANDECAQMTNWTVEKL